MGADRPLVSVGMPVFNGERHIREAIDSILNQTYENFEFIISDNASTDGTEEICRGYAAKDARISYYRNKENLGLARNYNRVFELSKAEYFKWAAHDDLCAPEYIERCVEVLDHMPLVVLCYTQTILVDKHGEYLQHCRDNCNLSSLRPSKRLRDLFSNLALSNPVFGVIRANTLRKTNLLGNYVASDITLLAELALRGNFYEVPDRLFFRRDHPEKSNRAYPTRDQRAILYDPKNRGKIHLPDWRLFFEHLFCIKRVQMSFYEKTCCYIYMAKWFSWKWRQLGRELFVAFKKIVHHARTSSTKLSN
ncbi:MAG: glycosyltransferase family 2 protein [Planctomycetota bacterium]|jgi:glycosyltransferase involved in cell wall biosynthesis